MFVQEHSALTIAILPKERLPLASLTAVRIIADSAQHTRWALYRKRRHVFQQRACPIEPIECSHKMADLYAKSSDRVISLEPDRCRQIPQFKIKKIWKEANWYVHFAV